ncbi:hypothetical protein LINGRAHAP2_LOCUS17644 [Linum grandiflorum]
MGSFFAISRSGYTMCIVRRIMLLISWPIIVILWHSVDTRSRFQSPPLAGGFCLIISKRTG